MWCGVRCCRWVTHAPTTSPPPRTSWGWCMPRVRWQVRGGGPGVGRGGGEGGERCMPRERWQVGGGGPGVGRVAGCVCMPEWQVTGGGVGVGVVLSCTPCLPLPLTCRYAHGCSQLDGDAVPGHPDCGEAQGGKDSTGGPRPGSWIRPRVRAGVGAEYPKP